jgi:uncharacterized membrane protein YkoI
MTNTLKKVFLTIAALAALALGGSAIAGATSGGPDTATQTKSEPAESNSSEAANEANDPADPADKADEGGKGETADKSETGDHQDAGDKELTGDVATRAREAAVAKTGGGKAGSVEAETEKTGASYDVEVVKTDGSKVDVFLDDQFKAISVESDEGK